MNRPRKVLNNAVYSAGLLSRLVQTYELRDRQNAEVVKMESSRLVQTYELRVIRLIILSEHFIV